MDKTKTIERETGLDSFADQNSESFGTQERLNSLLKANATYANQKEIFRTEQEKFEAELMTNPMSTEKAFSLFGAMLGAIPPATIFGMWIAEASSIGEDAIPIVLLLALVNTATAFAGYFSGKLVGKIVHELEKLSWHWMILALPFIGLFWGIISGGAGGVFIFIIGAIFGAMIGGAVGSVALPVFAILHRIFKKGDKIESKHFYPIAFGITFVLSALILGLPN